MSTYVYYLPASAQCRYFLNQVEAGGKATFEVVDGETSNSPHAFNLAPYHAYRITLLRTEKTDCGFPDFIVNVEKGPYQSGTEEKAVRGIGRRCFAGDCEPNMNCPVGTTPVCDSTGITKCVLLGTDAAGSQGLENL